MWLLLPVDRGLKYLDVEVEDQTLQKESGQAQVSTLECKERKETHIAAARHLELGGDNMIYPAPA